ncbi:MAG: mannitol dehydrogenase family protein, partial [Ruegeria sp.]
DDAAPVTHESFRQWVIEDSFCAGRPDWDKVGATFTDRVHDYEVMKLRILNAGHQVLANVGMILGIDTISDCMADSLVSAFFRKVEVEEIAPFVKPVPETSVADYISLIEHRFRNPAIVDTTRRVAFDGSSRHVGFVIPSIHDALAAGAPIDGLALVEALWARMCAGTREDGQTIEPNDPQWGELVTAAKAARDNPTAWLAQRQYYQDLALSGRFSGAFDRWLRMIWDRGAREALATYLAVEF